MTRSNAPEFGLLVARDPLRALALEHRHWQAVCDLMERIADGLPVNVEPADAAQLLAHLQRDLPRHRLDEDEGLFPLLRRQARTGGELSAILDTLAEEHRTDEVLAVDLVDELARLAAERRVEAPETFGLVLRSFCDAHRRHTRWEDLTVLPAARDLLGRDDLVRLGRVMAAHRGIRYRG